MMCQENILIKQCDCGKSRRNTFAFLSCNGDDLRYECGSWYFISDAAQRAQFGGPGAQPRPKMVFPKAEHLIMILIVVVGVGGFF
jgi:hypothetical protein